MFAQETASQGIVLQTDGISLNFVKESSTLNIEISDFYENFVR